MYRTSGVMTSIIKSNITRPVCLYCSLASRLVAGSTARSCSCTGISSFSPTSETLAPYSWVHQVLPAPVPHKCLVPKLLSMEAVGNINLLNTNTPPSWGFISLTSTQWKNLVLLLYWLSSRQIRAVSHTAVVQKLLCNDSEIQTQHRWNNGYVKPYAEKQDRVIHQGRAGVWVYTERVETERPSRVRPKEFLRVHGSRPKAVQGYSAILTPHKLSYRPPSQPDTNRPSDLYTETTNYNKADEQTKESLKGLLEIKAFQSVSPQWRTLTHDKQCDGQFFKPWSESVS